MKKLRQAEGHISDDSGGASINSLPLQLEASRSEALLLGSVGGVQDLNAQQVLALQRALRHGSTFGVWQTPREWGARAPSERSFSLRERIMAFLSPTDRQLIVGSTAEALETTAAGPSSLWAAHTRPEKYPIRVLDGAVLSAIRYMVLCRMGPAGFGKSANKAPLDPSSVRYLGYGYLPPMLAIAVSKLLAIAGSNEVDRFFALIKRADLDKLSGHLRARALRELNRMCNLRDQGLWRDVPNLDEPLKVFTSVKGEAVKPEAERITHEYIPLPDDYVSEMGSKSLWLVGELGPNLLRIAESIPKLWKDTDDLNVGPSAIAHRRRKLLQEYLKTFDWRDSSGSPIERPPFNLHLSALGAEASDDDDVTHVESGEGNAEQASRSLVWPPRNFAHVMGLLATLQRAHLFIAMMSEGARSGEVHDMTRNCVVHGRNGMPYVSGRTFKLVQRHDGEERDWVLPDAAVTAIEQQVRLVKIVERIVRIRPSRDEAIAPEEVAPSQNLWASLGSGSAADPTKPLGSLKMAFRLYADDLGMERRPGGKNVHPHRFRKTVARLCALALTQSPKILQDVFGHKSIEMTLYYILTDKALAAEVEQIARELRVMRAKEMVEDMVAAEEAATERMRDAPLAGYGGPAALAMSNAVKTEIVRVHRRGEQWTAANALGLAQVLTMGGDAWMYPRPGVICTKLPGEAGACNRSKGRPEPSNCDSECSHRLEEATQRRDVDETIARLIEDCRVAVEQGDLMTQSFLQEQLRQEVVRFKDLQDKWIGNAVVATAMNSATV